MLVIMYLSQFTVVRYFVFSLVLQMIPFIAFFSSADFLSDEQIAFGVGEGQQSVNIQAATTTNNEDSSLKQEGYVMYCPCMGKFSVLLCVIIVLGEFWLC